MDTYSIRGNFSAYLSIITVLSQHANILPYNSVTNEVERTSWSAILDMDAIFNDSTSFDKAINDELLCQILLYLGVDDLLIIPLVCSRWKRTDSEDEMLWRPHVTTLWKDKAVNRPSEMALMERVKTLPLSLMKRALFRVDISRCVEKPDFRSMLIARLIFGDRSPVKRQSRLFYPEWALRLGIYKASYFQAAKDMRRQDINVKELCLIKWVLHFKQSMNEDTVRPFEATFNEDFSLFTTMHGRMNWQFVDSPDGRCRIAVEQYPVHTSSRLKNGAWRIDNEYVWFEQIGTIDPENIPLM